MTARQRLQALAVCLLAWTQVGAEHYATQSGIPIRWYSDTVTVKVDAALTPDLPAADALAAIRDSCAAWNELACLQPVLADGGEVTGVDPIVGKSPNEKGNNLVIFEDTEAWLADDAPGKVPGVIALTTLFYSPSTGQARSYALEVNDGEFGFSAGSVAGKMDLANTLTHEFGHVLGLDHTLAPCRPGDPLAPTMCLSAPTGEVKKRTLESDDRIGICSLYATEYAEIDRSEGGGGGGCRAGGAPGPLAPLAVVAGLLAFAWNRSRRRPR